MPFRSNASQQLADMLSVLDHPHRLRIVEELGSGELDVASIAALLEISSSGTSQHLSKLRARRIVLERRDGRHVHYRLANPALSQWLLDGLTLLEADPEGSRDTKRDLRRARLAWSKH
ncbi:MAG: helix-turn-helix transcriptional regulator [Gemmatimonadaceae bacterium]|nr:helix-turn-helix transcriptional regulator [Gemmatimonadaceae bacterium]